MRCSRLDCTTEAAWKPVAMLPPPLPHSRTFAAPANLGDFHLCTKHCESLEAPVQFFTSEIQEQINVGFDAAKKVRPDWERAWWQFEALPTAAVVN